MPGSSLQERRRARKAGQRASKRSLFQSLGDLAPKLTVAVGSPHRAGDSYYRKLPFVRSLAAALITALVLVIIAIPLATVIQSGMARGGDDLSSFTFSLFSIFWMLGWSVGILIVVLVILMITIGRESIRVHNGNLYLYVGLPFLSVGAQYAGELIRGFRQEAAVTDSGSADDDDNQSQANNSGHKWRGDHLAFDYAGHAVRFGSAITDAEAAELLGALRNQFPQHAAPLPAGIQAGTTVTTEPVATTATIKAATATPETVSSNTIASDIKRTSLSSMALIAANLIPVAGVLFMDWQIMQVMLLFWAESAVIGLYNVAKMLRIAGLMAIFMGLFFIGHYGGFMAGHLLFIYTLFGDEAARNENIQMAQVWADFRFLAPALLGYVISHGVSYFTNFLGRQEYRHTDVNKQMAEPYKRIIVMHVTIILGGFLVTALDSPLPALLLLVALKAGVDLHSHLREHRGAKTDSKTQAGEQEAGAS